jgi:hypothetical protein
MAQESVEKFLGRLITDDGFRKHARDSLIEACLEHGYNLTHAEQEIIQTIDFDAFAPLSDIIDKRIKRS